MTEPAILTRSIGKLIGLMNLYSNNHPAVGQALSSTINNINEYLSANPELTIGVAEHRLIVGDYSVEDPGLKEHEFIELLEKAGIAGITIETGVSVDELRLMCTSLTTRQPDTVRFLSDNGVIHIKVNNVYYAKVKEGEVISSNSGNSGESGIEDCTWVDGLNKGSLESSIMKIISKVVKSPEDRKKIFSIILKQLEYEIEEKVKAATMTLEAEKRQITYDKERTEMVLSHVADGMIMVDDSGRILMMNETAEAIFGKTLKDKAGKHITEGIGEGHLLALSKDLSSAMKEGMEKEVELKAVDDTGHVLKSSTALVHNPAGKVVGMISVLTDITKQKELDRLKKDFVSHVTHELRTPLVAIKQALSLMVDKTSGAVNEQQEKMLHLMKRNIERLSKFINDLLDMDKIESGKLSVHQAAMDIRAVVNDVVQSLSPWASHQGIELTVVSPESLPSVYADSDRVVQILTNLVGNAVKFTGRGGRVSINVSNVKLKEEMNKFLKVSVIDNGRGIAIEDIDRIFEKFEQAGNKDSTDIKGSGLGLSIVKSLVEIHGGKIWVESQLGIGSKFTFSLPLYTEVEMRNLVAVYEEKPTHVQKKGLWQRLGFADGN
ncbi:MAG: PAS domain S-box protein [Nitrospirae bacterium]|nr:PAS domain S-box protein [Nitrospirota bacterium]